jgi:hypothetical protein
MNRLRKVVYEAMSKRGGQLGDACRVTTSIVLRRAPFFRCSTIRNPAP